MLKLGFDVQECVLRNHRIQLVILSDHDVVYHALKLGVDQEEEARV
jgi:hypothetical protein